MKNSKETKNTESRPRITNKQIDNWIKVSEINAKNRRASITR